MRVQVTLLQHGPSRTGELTTDRELASWLGAKRAHIEALLELGVQCIQLDRVEVKLAKQLAYIMWESKEDTYTLTASPGVRYPNGDPIREGGFPTVWEAIERARALGLEPRFGRHAYLECQSDPCPE